MNILSNFYTTNITSDPKYKFSQSGVYYCPPKGSYEDYVEFIKVGATAPQPVLASETSGTSREGLGAVV